MAATGGNEVDDAIRELKSIPGFSAYAILNNDGRSLSLFLLDNHCRDCHQV